MRPNLSASDIQRVIALKEKLGLPSYMAVIRLGLLELQEKHKDE